jgi:hypothetical protein
LRMRLQDFEKLLVFLTSHPDTCLIRISVQQIAEPAED